MAAIVVSSDKLKAAGNQTTITISAFTTSGSNRAIVADFAARRSSAFTFTDVVRGADTYAEQAAIADSDPRVRVGIWGSTNEPVTASTTLAGTVSSTEENWIFGYRALTGVDQTTRFDSIQSGAGTGGGDASLTVTSAIDDIVLDVLSLRAGIDAPTIGASQTLNWSEVSGSGGSGNCYGRASSEVGAASVDMTWDWPSTTNFAHVAMNVNAAVVAGDIAAVLPGEFSVAAALTGDGKLDSAIPFEYSVIASLLADGKLDSTIPFEYSVIASLLADGKLDSAILFEFSVVASLVANGKLDSTIPFEYDVVANLLAQGQLSAALPMEYNVTANLVAAGGAISGVLPIEYNVIASLVANGQLASTLAFEFNVAASLLDATAGALSAVLPMEFTVAGTVINASIPVYPFIERRHIAAFFN